MTNTLRNMYRYIRNTDAFGWQGADSPDGPWRAITPPQSGAPWQTTSPMDDLRQASADVSGVEVLSPAAKTVLDALPSAPHLQMVNRAYAAAALRAAVDQVVPLHICGTNATRAQTRLGIRHKLLTIAAELEGHV